MKQQSNACFWTAISTSKCHSKLADAMCSKKAQVLDDKLIIPEDLDKDLKDFVLHTEGIFQSIQTEYKLILFWVNLKPVLKP